MARAIWKGSISFGLVTIPVGLHSAIDSADRLSFRLLHAKDRSPIDYKRFCEAEDVEVRWQDIVKGFEYRRGEYVVLTDEDFEKAQAPGTQTFEVRAFVPAADVEDLYFDHPYYLAPAGRGATKGYALLRDALEEEGKLGIGTIVIRQREHLAAITPAGPALVLTTMRFAHEIRSPKTLDLPQGASGWSKKEMTLARQLIGTLSAAWNPKDYRDTYATVLRDIIKRKAKGQRIEAPRAERTPRVVNLMEALERSVRSAPRALDVRSDKRRPRRKARTARAA
jgi:DNA end-binding protein Ku